MTDALPRVPLTPPGARTHHIQTGAGTVRVLCSGEPTPGRLPLMLVHGGGTDNAGISWYRLLEPLGRDREVWALDLPGFGGSIELDPVGGPHELAAVVADVIETLGGPMAVGGVSMGGDVALNLALDRPDVVAALVCIAPGGLAARVGGPVTQFSAWAAAQLPDWILLPMARFANRFVKYALNAMVTDPMTLPDPVVSEFVREARDPRGGVAYGRYNQATLGRTGMLNDLSDVVSRITVPTMFFHGENDPLVDPAGSRRAAARMPRARLVTAPHCGHWAQLEAHELFLASVRDFLFRVDESRLDGDAS